MGKSKLVGILIRTAAYRKIIFFRKINSDFGPMPKKTIFPKLQTAIYPSNMTPINAKIWENAFQTIPGVSFFDSGNEKSCFFWQTLNGPLPLEDGSDRHETLGKRVSDDSRHFILNRHQPIRSDALFRKKPKNPIFCVQISRFGGAAIF